MTYRVQFSKEVQRQIGRLPGHVRNQAKQRIVALRSQPRPPDARELAGHDGFYRIWLDRDFRMVWQVDDDVQVVDIFYIGPKTPGLYGKLGLERQ